MKTLRNIAGKKSIITKSYAGNEGKIVTCIRLATGEETRKACLLRTNETTVWVVDMKLPLFNRFTQKISESASFMYDDWMTPLQDLDEPEQQVQELYAPSPSKVLDEVK